MKKSKLNLVIDMLLLLALAALAGTGLLMKYVLVPGSERREIYGSNVELFLGGMDRHQWGEIHLIVGYVFLALLILHVVLHWSMVVGIYRKLIPNLALRWIVAFVLLVLVIAFVIFPFIVEPDVQERERGGGGGRRRGQARVSSTEMLNTLAPNRLNLLVVDV